MFTIVPQSEAYVVERLGRYSRTLGPGLKWVSPFLERVAHRIPILEQQLDSFRVSVITKDNVEVEFVATIFFRVDQPRQAVYGIRDFRQALHTAATSIVRNAGGQMELDALQTARERINEEIQQRLGEAAETWGIEVTRTEITDIIVDDETKAAQRQQLNAERERRATIAAAEGQQVAAARAADAALYQAQREAEAMRVKADAEAFAAERLSVAQAVEIEQIGRALKQYGTEAAQLAIQKQQIDAIGALAASQGTQSLILPVEVAGVLGTLNALAEQVRPNPNRHT